MKKLVFPPVFTLFFLIPLLLSCSSPSSNPPQPKNSTTELSGQAMFMPYRIIIGKMLDPDAKARSRRIIAATFNEIDRIYNKYNPDSELSHLNNLKAGHVVKISSEMEKILQLTDEIVQLSEGRFDPTINPLQSLWRHHLEIGNIPPKEDIFPLIPAIGWHNVTVKDGSFVKAYDQTSLDLGGIAKGLGVDLLVENLHRAGFPNIYVEWGGEIRCLGEHPDQRPWTIAISRFGDQTLENAVTTIPVQNRAIATSGDYEQYWKIKPEDQDQEVIYFHIINPKTYQPLLYSPSRVGSATVSASTCAQADALATVAMMFDSIEEAKEWAETVQKKYPDTAFWLITRE